MQYTGPGLRLVDAVVQIAHLVPPGLHPFSGVLTSLVRLAIAQARRGNTIQLWQPEVWPAVRGDLEYDLNAAGVERVMLRSPRATFSRRLNSTGALTGRPADIVHLHGVFNPFNNHAARHLSTPLAISPHGGYAPEALAYHALRKRVYARLFELRMLRRASVVCALTAAEKMDIRRFGVRGHVEIVPNGVTMPASVPPPIRPDLRRELGWPEACAVAIYVGRLDVRAKRLDVAVRAMAELPDWRLAIVGGDFRDGARTLQRMISQLGLGDRVRLIGPRCGAALDAAVASADVLLLLSRSEGLPMALLEAAAHGVPSVVSPEVEHATGVAASAAGWCSRVDEVVATLHTVASSTSVEREAVRQRALHYARRHDWATVAARSERVYEMAIAGDNDRSILTPVAVSS